MQATRGQQQHIGDSTAAVLHHGDVEHATVREAQDEFRHKSENIGLQTSHPHQSQTKD